MSQHKFGTARWEKPLNEWTNSQLSNSVILPWKKTHSISFTSYGNKGKDHHKTRNKSLHKTKSSKSSKSQRWTKDIDICVDDVALENPLHVKKSTILLNNYTSSVLPKSLNTSDTTYSRASKMQYNTPSTAKHMVMNSNVSSPDLIHSWWKAAMISRKP